MLTTLRSNRGFTLVEMAIVLVIIGLLLGGVLKGQELIDNSRVKAAVNEMNAVSVAYNGYLDRYRAIPGDDGPLATLRARGTNWATITAVGNQDGVLTINPADTFTGGNESVTFWQAVKAAGFITGNPASAGIAALPPNSFQGLVGIANNSAVPAITGMPPGLSVCLSQVPGKAAAQIDTQFDDGLPNRGSVRATVGVPGVNTVPAAAPVAYSENNQYTVCKTL